MSLAVKAFYWLVIKFEMKVMFGFSCSSKSPLKENEKPEKL